MNQFDRENFDFMMQLSDEEFDEFFADMPIDDIDYAIELIQQARSDLLVQEYNLLDSEEPDLAEAQAVLSRIMAL
jgi:hypothetical protein